MTKDVRNRVQLLEPLEVRSQSDYHRRQDAHLALLRIDLLPFKHQRGFQRLENGTYLMTKCICTARIRTLLADERCLCNGRGEVCVAFSENSEVSSAILRNEFLSRAPLKWTRTNVNALLGLLKWISR